MQDLNRNPLMFHMNRQVEKKQNPILKRVNYKTRI